MLCSSGGEGCCGQVQLRLAWQASRSAPLISASAHLDPWQASPVASAAQDGDFQLGVLTFRSAPMATSPVL